MVVQLERRRDGRKEGTALRFKRIFSDDQPISLSLTNYDDSVVVVLVVMARVSQCGVAIPSDSQECEINVSIWLLCSAFLPKRVEIWYGASLYYLLFWLLWSFSYLHTQLIGMKRTFTRD